MTRFRVNDYDKKLDIVMTEEEYQLGTNRGTRGKKKIPNDNDITDTATPAHNKVKKTSKKSNYTPRDPGHFFESVFC